MRDWSATLRQLHFSHLDGDPDAARKALEVCAVTCLPMPPWLAEIVKRALVKSDRGEADDVLGMGSEKARVRLRKRYLGRRNTAIAQDHDYLRQEGERDVTEHLARLHKLSPKTIEKAIAKTKRK